MTWLMTAACAVAGGLFGFAMTDGLLRWHERRKQKRFDEWWKAEVERLRRNPKAVHGVLEPLDEEAYEAATVPSRDEIRAALKRASEKIRRYRR